MKQPTKQQLRVSIEDLKRDIYKCIGHIPDGELKKTLQEKYPQWFAAALVEKYGDSGKDLFIEMFGKEAETIIDREFHWFEPNKNS